MAFTSQNVPVAETVSTTALSLSDAGYSAAQIAGAYSLRVSASQPCRYLFGGTPTATFGEIIEANQEPVVFDNEDFDSFRIIRQGGTDADVTYVLSTFVEV